MKFPDQRAKEEEAIRKAQAASRDQADAGALSREEAGKFYNLLSLPIQTSLVMKTCYFLSAPINRHSKISFTFLTRCDKNKINKKKSLNQIKLELANHL
jgi:hypothetical protein